MKTSLRLCIGIASLILVTADVSAAATTGTPTDGVGRSRADGELDVTLSATSIRVRSGACPDVPFVVRHDFGYLDRFTAEVEVWKGSRYIDETFDYVYESSGPIRSTLSICVNKARDLGTYRIGPTRGEYNDYSIDLDGTYTDASTTTFKVLQHSRFGTVSTTRVGRTRTFKSRLTYFDAGTSSFRSAPRGIRIRLQRLAANGSWTTVAAARVGIRGRVAIPIKASTARTYRLVSPETARTWSAKSRTARR